MQKTLLLCTFADKASLDYVLEHINCTYELAFETIYILQNVEDPDQLILTYNIVGDTTHITPSQHGTISVHRKKKTNTIYTINALNKLIVELTGSTNVNYPIDWDSLQNVVLVTAYGKLKKIRTQIYDIIKYS